MISLAEKLELADREAWPESWMFDQHRKAVMSRVTLKRAGEVVRLVERFYQMNTEGRFVITDDQAYGLLIRIAEVLDPTHPANAEPRP